jgi:phenylacetate-CoA ligase
VAAPPDLLPALRIFARRSRISRSELDAFRDARLRKLLDHAYVRVPYYRTLFDAAGVRPQDISGVADLHRIPLSSKEEIRAHAEHAIIAEDVNPAGLQTVRTSGSTAKPFDIRRSRSEQKLQALFWIGALRSMGVRPWHRIAQISLRPPTPAPFAHRLRRSVRSYGIHRIDLFLKSEEILAELQRIRPHVILGYPTALSRVALIAQHSGRPVRPRLVITGSEAQTPQLRARIADGFAAPVLQWYGSFEFSVMAWSCSTTGNLHTADESVILEVLKDGRPADEGEEGEVVATNLHAFNMPFIRYRLRDLAIRGPASCRCGRPYQSLLAVKGRTFDYFTLPDGRLMHPYQLTHAHVASRDWVGQIQLVQERVDHIALRLVPARDPGHAELAELRAALQNVLGPLVSLSIEMVSDIPAEASGKFRAYRSLVHSDYGSGR